MGGWVVGVRMEVILLICLYRFCSFEQDLWLV